MNKAGILRKVHGLQKATTQLPCEHSGLPLHLLNQALKAQTEAEIIRELPEEAALLTKRHLRAARSVKSAGDRLGATIDRLPIHAGQHHQRGYRHPRIIEFEGPLVALVEKYGPSEAFEHMSQGQLTKYQLADHKGSFEIRNVRTGEVEWPKPSPARRLISQMGDLLDGDSED
ncbi:MAG: hypothetical protein UY48_C0038G0026 [Candidatus Gottesmanbacteria bacterium GW2011_GWB1_49_7]|uniref:Uncharacterized protein n=1 Tax=Candidatus Gottesmanbacteria bacterium GW2011_GWB1_49_7 TaxID=1618448 RepID=A0A0G1VVD3_9BACT|nr:MAG: hypothetical protein UY48_C0038G0026 [Candidatus Gottesmanbacteria bacterium GW2011_GWB1_49_7]